MINMPNKINIKNHCDYISSCLDEYESKAEPVWLLKASDTMKILRKLYKQDSHLFTSEHIFELKKLSSLLNEKLIIEEDKLMSIYEEMIKQQRGIRMACDICRQTLVKIFKGQNYNRKKYDDGSVVVSRKERIKVPHQSTLEYKKLIDLIKENDTWDKVVVLSTVLMKKAMEKGLFSKEDMQIIQTLCSIENTYRIRIIASSMDTTKEIAWNLIESGEYAACIEGNNENEEDEYLSETGISKDDVFVQWEEDYSELSVCEEDEVDEEDWYDRDLEELEEELLEDAKNYSRSIFGDWFYPD